MILLAILLPPLAVLLKGKPIQAVLNIFLTALFWIPGVIHAILVVNAANADERTRRLEMAIRESAEAQAQSARTQQAQVETQAPASQAALPISHADKPQGQTPANAAAESGPTSA